MRKCRHRDINLIMLPQLVSVRAGVPAQEAQLQNAYIILLWEQKALQFEFEFEFPIANITNFHKLSSLTQIIILEVWRSEVLSGGLRTVSIFLPFPAPRVCLHSSVMASFHFKGQQWQGSTLLQSDRHSSARSDIIRITFPSLDFKHNYI